MASDPLEKPTPVELQYAEVTLTDETPPVSDFEYACETCGVELTYGGRGRKPRFCADHKKGAPRATVRAAASGRWQAPLAQALTNQFIGIGMVAYAFDAFDGQTIISGSPNLASSLIGVAETNASVRSALEKFVQAGAWAQVATAVAAIALPIMAHHKLIPNIPAFAGAPA